MERKGGREEERRERRGREYQLSSLTGSQGIHQVEVACCQSSGAE